MGVWIHYSPNTGDVVVLATVCYNSLSSRFPFSITYFALAGRPWSQESRDYLKSWSWICTGCTHRIRAPWSLSLMPHAYTLTGSVVQIYFADYIVIIVTSCIYPVYSICMYIYYVPLFSLSFFRTLARSYLRPWVCMPDLEPLTTSSEEDQEYIDGLAEQQ